MEALRRMVCKPVYACDIIFYKFTPRHEKLKCFHASVQHHPLPATGERKTGMPSLKTSTIQSALKKRFDVLLKTPRRFTQNTLTFHIKRLGVYRKTSKRFSHQSIISTSLQQFGHSFIPLHRIFRLPPL